MTYRYALQAAGLIVSMSGLATAALAQDGDATYRALLSPLNAQVVGSQTAGEAIFTVAGDDLTIHVTVSGAPPSIAHLQHFHGFKEGMQKSECPTARSDTNGDGIIDLIETEPLAGITMVPFHDDPVSMEIVRDTYPTADDKGSYTYEKSVSLKALEDAFAAQFPGQELDLTRRVVFVHGVPASTELPDSVASLGDIPAQITLPIACGAIMKVEQ